MVGIITHIPELRDELAQQVIVAKLQGFSTVKVRGASEGELAETFDGRKQLA
jgi:hypothetical protein